jgi:sarcosine oxidase, subunit beta
MAQSYDAIIIGAGVIGAAIGLEMARAGRKTLNIDKLPAAGYGPTSNSCAIIRVHYSTLDGTALAYDGYFYWKKWAEHIGVEDELGLAEFHDCGCLIMKTEENKHVANVMGHVEALGIPHEHWDAKTVTEKLPMYQMKRFSPPRALGDPKFGEPAGGELPGGVFFPTAGYISDPQLSTHNLQRAAEAAGGTFLFNQQVVEIPIENNRVTGVVLVDGTRINAPIVVNVSGPHSTIVNQMVGADADMTITTKPVRQEVVHVASPTGVDFERDGMVVSDNDIGCYIRPETGNHILVGSEDPECDPREVVDPDDYNRDLTDQALAQAYRYAQRAPSLEVSPRPRGVVDLYDVSDDWIPIYDRSKIDGFYMAIGTSGNQFKNAPCAGRMMAQLIDYCEAGNDHDAKPFQYTLEYVDRTIDTATFSRRRKINPNSSFSVLG